MGTMIRIARVIFDCVTFALAVLSLAAALLSMWLGHVVHFGECHFRGKSVAVSAIPAVPMHKAGISIVVMAPVDRNVEGDFSYVDEEEWGQPGITFDDDLKKYWFGIEVFKHDGFTKTYLDSSHYHLVGEYRNGFHLPFSVALACFVLVPVGRLLFVVNVRRRRRAAAAATDHKS